MPCVVTKTHAQRHTEIHTDPIPQAPETDIDTQTQMYTHDTETDTQRHTHRYTDRHKHTQEFRDTSHTHIQI